MGEQQCLSDGRRSWSVWHANTCDGRPIGSYGIAASFPWARARVLSTKYAWHATNGTWSWTIRRTILCRSGSHGSVVIRIIRSLLFATLTHTENIERKYLEH